MRNTCNAHLSVTALTINRSDWKAWHNAKEFYFLFLFVYDTSVCIACVTLFKQIQYQFTSSSQTLPRYKRSELYAYSAWTTAFSERKYNTPSPETQTMKTADKLLSKDTSWHTETICYTNTLVNIVSCNTQHLILSTM